MNKINLAALQLQLDKTDNLDFLLLQLNELVKNRDDILKIIYKHLGPLEWDHKDIKRGILNLVNNS